MVKLRPLPVHVILIDEHPHALDPESRTQVTLHLRVQPLHVRLGEQLRSRRCAAHDRPAVLTDQRHPPVPHRALRVALDLASPVRRVLLLVLGRPSQRVRLVVGHHLRLDNRHEREVHVRFGTRLVQMHVGAHHPAIAHPVAQEAIGGIEERHGARTAKALGHGHDQVRERLGLRPDDQALGQLAVAPDAPALVLGGEVVDGQVPVDVVALAYRALIVGEHPARVRVGVSSQMHRRRHLSKSALSSRLVRLTSYTLPRVYHSGFLRPFAAALTYSKHHLQVVLGTASGGAGMDGLRPSKPPHEGALRPFRNPQVDDLSFVICHIIFFGRS